MINIEFDNNRSAITTIGYNDPESGAEINALFSITEKSLHDFLSKKSSALELKPISSRNPTYQNYSACKNEVNSSKVVVVCMNKTDFLVKQVFLDGEVLPALTKAEVMMITDPDDMRNRYYFNSPQKDVVLSPLIVGPLDHDTNYKGIAKIVRNWTKNNLQGSKNNIFDTVRATEKINAKKLTGESTSSSTLFIKTEYDGTITLKDGKPNPETKLNDNESSSSSSSQSAASAASDPKSVGSYGSPSQSEKDKWAQEREVRMKDPKYAAGYAAYVARRPQIIAEAKAEMARAELAKEEAARSAAAAAAPPRPAPVVATEAAKNANSARKKNNDTEGGCSIM